MEVLKIISKSGKETKKIGKILGIFFAKEKVFLNNALVIALQGDLGAGKTTFVQGFAQGLGIKESIKSPSFALLKIFDLPAVALAKAGLSGKFNHLLHFDFYRLEKPTKKELNAFNFSEFLKNPQNLIIAEWSEKVKKFLPKRYLKIKFKILGKNTRELKFAII